MPPLPFGLEDEDSAGVAFAAGSEEGFGIGRPRHRLIREPRREEEEEEEMRQGVCRLRDDLMWAGGGVG